MTSTQSTTSGVTSNFTTHSGMSSSASFQPPIPSPRRCRPNDSLSDYGNLNPDSDKQRAPIYVPGDYRINFQTNSSSGNPFIDESTKATQEDLSRYAAYFGNFKSFSLTEPINIKSFSLFIVGSNYFPYKPDTNLAYTRDYRSFPDYGYTERESFNNRQSLHDSLSPPGSGNFNDYRSPDSQTSAINHGYQDDFEHPCGKLSSKFQSLEMNYSDTVSTPTGLNRMRGYESVPLRLSDNTQYSSNTNPFLPLDDVNEEKTHQLEHGGLQTTSRLRSSLKKNNSSSHKLQSSGSQTPEHGTSDDSSYMSAKENSLSSQQSRVRFSPDNLFEVSDDGMQNANVRMNFTR